MPRFRMLLAAALVVAAATTTTAQAQRSPAPAHGSMIGSWRVTQVTPAPWAPRRATPLATWLDAVIRFEPTRVIAPGVLGCREARYAGSRTTVEGLFQGNLTPPRQVSARSLGFKDSIVTGTSLSCSTGLFEFHFADNLVALVAIDDQILTLSRSAGALAADSSAAGVVRRLLARHFNGDMGFSKAAVAEKRRWLSASLAARIDRYFAVTRPADEVPPVNGDPFTNSQEYPARFTIAQAMVRGGRATVPVRFDDAWASRTVVYHLTRDRGAWRVDDLAFEDGGTLRALLE